MLTDVRLQDEYNRLQNVKKKYMSEARRQLVNQTSQQDLDLKLGKKLEKVVKQ